MSNFRMYIVNLSDSEGINLNRQQRFSYVDKYRLLKEGSDILLLTFYSKYRCGSFKHLVSRTLNKHGHKCTQCVLSKIYGYTILYSNNCKSYESTISRFKIRVLI